MTSAGLIQNALWHCLRPCGPQVSHRGVYFAGPLLPNPQKELAFAARLIHNRGTPLPHIHRLSRFISSKRPSSELRPIARLWIYRCLHGAAQNRPDFLQTNHPRSKEVNIILTFAELHQQARKGQYKEVQEIAGKLLREYGEKPNHHMYEALILANIDCRNGSANEVARLLQDMGDEGIEPDTAILHAALQVLAIHPDYLLRSHILHELRQRWLPLTQNGWHDVVVGLLRDRQLERSLHALEKMQKEGVTPYPWLYDTMIYILCSAEEFDEALRLLEHCIESDDLSISPTLWSYALDSASRALHYPLTLFAFNARVKTSYLNPSSGVCTNILSTATRQGDTHLATSILHVLSRRTGSPVQRHHYEALLETYVASKDLRTAFTLLVTMEKAGFTPTEASTRPIFTYLRQPRESPEKAREILYSLRDEGVTILIQAVNVLIESYIYHQNLSAALELYKSMQTLSCELGPDTATFNALLRGCALYKRKDVAMFLASEMVALKITPDALTYDRLLLVCLTSDDGLGNAWRYLEEMKAAGWWPRGGTAIRFAKKACALGDPRVWDLVQDGQGRGISKERVDSLLTGHGSGGVEAAKAELRTYTEQRRDGQ